MTDLFKLLHKYIALTIVAALFGTPWFYLRLLLLERAGHRPALDWIPTTVDYAYRLVVIVLLIVDFKRHRLRYAWLACVATLLYPLLGIVIFALLLIERDRNPATVD